MSAPHSVEKDVLLRAVEKMRADADRCGDAPDAFIPAVADWLSEAADHLAAQADADAFPPGSVCPTALEGLECSMLQQAVAVARAYVLPPAESMRCCRDAGTQECRCTRPLPPAETDGAR